MEEEREYSLWHSLTIIIINNSLGSDRPAVLSLFFSLPSDEMEDLLKSFCSTLLSTYLVNYSLFSLVT
ncbi:hypothetical protein KFK09_011077 [Dendrobium nobile]|uniref:Uncharacterized protein n=1 Tax=Dendrobium nobile TaxID=94219 RepID=A0A8T3BEY1_DENNO|nr:hypothetical protein KFK09_011077 [Dendrobium nobile]